MRPGLNGLPVLDQEEPLVSASRPKFYDMTVLARARTTVRACVTFTRSSEQLLAIGDAVCAAPRAVAGRDVQTECSSRAGADVVLDGSLSSDSKAGSSQGGSTNDTLGGKRVTD